MIKHGMKRALVNLKARSYTRSFGLTTPQPLPPRTYTYDKGLSTPDQNADGLPYGCTGYAQSHVASNEDGVLYDPRQTYVHTCLRENHDITLPCTIDNSMAIGSAFGMWKPGETDDSIAGGRRRGKPFRVERISGMDWFDSFRSVLRSSGKSISTGTIWFREWESTQNGILTSDFVYSGNADQYPWHNYEISGEKVIDGVPYLEILSWQGPNYGLGGFVYLDRKGFNRSFDIWGTVGDVQGPYAPQDIQYVRLEILQFIVYYLGRILGLKAYA